MVTHDSRTLLASAARTTTQTLADQTNLGHRGLHLIIDVTAITDTPILTPKIQGRGANGVYYDLLVATAISATGTTVLKLYPGITAAANAAANDVLPAVWRLVLTATDADSATYSVAVCLLP